MLRLIAFLVTGFWPSHRSVLALNRRVDLLEQRLSTLSKKHNTLAGSYYAETELEDRLPLPAGSTAIAPVPFPDDEFEELRATKRRLTSG